jgi:hypothetical protein
MRAKYRVRRVKHQQFTHKNHGTGVERPAEGKESLCDAIFHLKTKTKQKKIGTMYVTGYSTGQ